MNKTLSALKKKLSDNKTVVIAATVGVASATIASVAVYKYFDSKTLIEVTPNVLSAIKNGATGRISIDGIDFMLKLKDYV